MQEPDFELIHPLDVHDLLNSASSETGLIDIYKTKSETTFEVARTGKRYRLSFDAPRVSAKPNN